LAYVAIVRSELQYGLRGWAASFRLHVGFLRPVTSGDIETCSDNAASIDVGSGYFGAGLRSLRSVQSQLIRVVSTEISRTDGLKHFLNIGDAVGHGEDSGVIAISAGQAVQVEWIVEDRGRGVNGRSFFPYMGASVHNATWIDSIEPAASQAIELIANQWAAFTSLATGGEPVVCRRQRSGAPSPVTDSSRVRAVAVRRDTFVHQRRRVEWRRPFDLTP
jgi:hypothetical protein